MTTEERLIKAQEELDEQILNNDKTSFVDGIINITKYLNTNPKILWILKEPNSTEENLNWRDEIKKLNTNGNLSGFAKTFANIVYISKGILSKKNWGALSWIKDDIEMLSVLEEIAFINIKKTPGGRNSNDSELADYYELNKEIVLKQIKYFEPNIIIGGNTIKFIIDDLKKEYPNLIYNEYISSTDLGVHQSIDDNLIIFDARHPQNTNTSSEKYCNDVIDKYISLCSN